MKVPYSMDDSEPDLVAPWGGTTHEACYEDSSSYSPPPSQWKPPPSRPVMYSFCSEEELVTSEVFQKHLSRCLAHKDKQIASLRQELMDTL